MSGALKNFGFRRKSGILMPISSLPCPYGIGSFGKSAYDFVDFLSATGTGCWQVLPLNPTSYGDSPYQSPASCAGNPYFIDLEILYKKNLITKEELKCQKASDFRRVNYGVLFNSRYKILRSAYRRYRSANSEESTEYKTFLRKNSSWIEDYSLFMSLKEHFGYLQWTLWTEEYKNHDAAVTKKHLFKEEMSFWKWVQYEFDSQWQSLRAYENDRGIKIIGDMPIYVAHDSMEVWQSPEQFLLDENFNPTVVAGCPPDGFSPDGQLWGNPIYNWELMKSSGFVWWCNRVKNAFRMYDILRIDHFRGFSGYYSIPYGDTTAKNGKWNSAPGIELFREIKSRFPKAKIIAEDLGHITDDVRELLTDTGFPGMKMLHFAFYDADNEYLPRMYTTENCVAYAGSHDSDCIVSWYKNLDENAKKRFVRECPHIKGQSRVMDLIALALKSRAALAVVPMQDYLELNNAEGRINTPSVAEGNWTWRISPRYRTEKLIYKIKNLTLSSKR